MNYLKRNTFHQIKIFKYLLLITSFNAKAETNYLPPDPYLIIGENNEINTADEISKKISQLQDKNKEMRSKILSLQDALISKFKDRIELKIEVISNYEKQNSQFGFIELSAIMNNISIIHYSKPVFFEKNINLPIFNGPLPVGVYNIKVHALVGQLNNNWPYVLPQGKWAIDKNIEIIGTLSSAIHNIKLILKQNKLTKIPEFEIEKEELKENL
ncbi:hypothetical protein [Silvanigrella sp.]|jgi:hypothetical protein|uniref:hypothetical protein n=1 Tax=Silvanigrella sp. TaxID=2024976 RepID=UPI0037CA4A37|nr:hypothetical protein [Silvanigrellaceae bacterium]